MTSDTVHVLRSQPQDQLVALADQGGGTEDARPAPVTAPSIEASSGSPSASYAKKLYRLQREM